MKKRDNRQARKIFSPDSYKFHLEPRFPYNVYPRPGGIFSLRPWLSTLRRQQKHKQPSNYLIQIQHRCSRSEFSINGSERSVEIEEADMVDEVIVKFLTNCS